MLRILVYPFQLYVGTNITVTNETLFLNILFILADAINDQHSVLDEVLHSRTGCIFLFLRVPNVSPNW